MELSRAAMAWARRNQANPRRRYRLAQVAANEALQALRPEGVLRVSFVQRIFWRDSGPVDEPRDRSRALVYEGQLPPLGHGAWRNFCLARWPRERRYVSGLVRISEGLSCELRDKLWERRPVLDALHGKESYAYECRR